MQPVSEPPGTSQSIRIVARPNGVGIDRDVHILTDAIAAWHAPPTFSGHRSISPLRAIVDPHGKDDCIVFLERVKRRWLRRGRRFLLIPNQERYATRQLDLLRRVDHVLVKTLHAQEVFARHHPSVHLVGFTSVDRNLPDVTPDYGTFFHLAGGSALKGTATLLEVWARHPDWPTLTVLYHRDAPLPHVPDNVNVIRTYLPDGELRAIQNRMGIQICTSLSEGWGHAIVEGMSCGAVVVTTDGPPMNEIIRPDRGVLVPFARSEPRKLGTNFLADPDALDAAVHALIVRPESDKAELGRRARAWFEENDRAFRVRLRDVLEKVLGG